MTYCSSIGPNTAFRLPLLGKLTEVTFLLTLASLVFHYSIVQHYALCAFGLCYWTDYAINRRWQGWRWQGYMSIFVALIVLWLLPPLWQLFDATPPTPYYRSYVEHTLPFLGVGVIGILGADWLRFRHITWVMLIAGAFFTLFSVGYTIHLYPNWARVDFHSAYNTAVPHLNTHMLRNMYFNVALILALFSSHDSVSHAADTQTIAWWKVVRRVVKVLLVLLTVLGVLLSDGRIGLAIMLATLMFAAFYYLPRRLNWLKALSVVLAVVAVTVWVSTATKMAPEVRSKEPRPYVWKYATQMYMERPMLGRGMSSMDVNFAQGAVDDPVMKERYVDYIKVCFPHFADYEPSFKWIHPHNAFLQYGIAFGVVGIVVLMLLFVLPLIYPCNPEHRMALYIFCFAMFVQCMTDVVGPGISPLFFSAMLLVFYRSR